MTEQALEVWEGNVVERARRQRRRPEGQVAFHDLFAGLDEAAVPDINNEEEERVEEDEEVVAEDNEAVYDIEEDCERQSSDHEDTDAERISVSSEGGSSSSSSSSSSTSDNVGDAILAGDVGPSEANRESEVALVEALDPAQGRVRAGPDTEAQLQLRAFSVGAGKTFRITPKQGDPSSGSGEFGGYQANCPFHAKNQSSGCRKYSPLAGPLERHRREALIKLYWWLLQHSEV